MVPASSAALCSRYPKSRPADLRLCAVESQVLRGAGYGGSKSDFCDEEGQ